MFDTQLYVYNILYLNKMHDNRNCLTENEKNLKIFKHHQI